MLLNKCDTLLEFMIWQRLNQYSSIDSKFLRRQAEMMQETVKDKANNNTERERERERDREKKEANNAIVIM